MKERLLVLAKAAPESSSKYEELVCVAGITESGEWRWIYPIPWSVFWKSSGVNFKKKSWIEYELQGESRDYRPESRRIKFETLKPGEEAKFKDIESLLKERATRLEELQKLGPKVRSLGVVEPKEILDFVQTDNPHYEKLVKRGAQTNLSGERAVKLEIPEFKYRYKFKDDGEGDVHESLCEDWEAVELYRKCEQYRKEGKYKDKAEVDGKVRQKMLHGIAKYGHVYFVMGSHFRFPSYMVVGVVYPRKADLAGL